MPRTTNFGQASIEEGGALGLTLLLRYVDEDGVPIQSTPLRRVVDPNGDIDQNVDDLNAWLVANKYPEIAAATVTLLRDLETAARAHPDIEASRAKWIEDHQPPPEQPATE